MDGKAQSKNKGNVAGKKMYGQTFILSFQYISLLKWFYTNIKDELKTWFTQQIIIASFNFIKTF